MTKLREPLTIKHLRKKANLAPQSDLAVVLAYADRLRDALEDAAAQHLTDLQVLQAAGPPTNEIGGQQVWEMGERELHKFAQALVAALMRERVG